MASFQATDVEQHLEQEVNSSDGGEGSSAQQNTLTGDLHRKKRGKTANPAEWERFVMKRSRLEGKPYVSRSVVNGVKCVKERPGRTLGPPCGSKICSQENFKRQCCRFSEEERTQIHSMFWNNITWEQRKQFVVCHVCNESASNKVRNKITYFLTNKYNERIVVCKKMFLNTLSLGEKSVLSWLQGSQFGILAPTIKKRSPERKEFRITSIPQFLESIHKDKIKNKMFVKYSTKDDIYKDYAAFCQQKQLNIGSRVTFNRAFVKAGLNLRSVKKNSKKSDSNNPNFGSSETNAYPTVQSEACMYQGYGNWNNTQYL